MALSDDDAATRALDRRRQDSRHAARFGLMHLTWMRTMVQFWLVCSLTWSQPAQALDLIVDHQNGWRPVGDPPAAIAEMTLDQLYADCLKNWRDKNDETLDTVGHCSSAIKALQERTRSQQLQKIDMLRSHCQTRLTSDRRHVLERVDALTKSLAQASAELCDAVTWAHAAENVHSGVEGGVCETELQFAIGLQLKRIAESLENRVEIGTPRQMNGRTQPAACD